jgi:hypothetical protein
MFDLIVLGLVLAGVALIARAPVSNHRPEIPNRPVPNLWSARTDWRRFNRPTYLRRGIVPGDGQGRSTPPAVRPSLSGEAAPPEAAGEAP